ncbi:MAG: protein kinase [Anaerolineae bacterium]|nr:protein kinase [Anaerolineae bacterium]
MSVDNLAGQTLGQYELRELLGAGGMGAVYRAHQKNLKRWVAVKVLPATLAGQTLYLERFNREAQTAASLEHQHIVPVYDYGLQRGTSYVVMRLLTGGTLADRLNDTLVNEKPLPSPREVAELIKQIASALDYAHARGVIHRDVKPSNIMFDDQGVAFLVDFGIAKLIEGTGAGLTGTNMTMGTPSFMPPEQWRGEKVTPASDQYSLAVITYQLLVGKLPFEATTPYALMHKHLNETPPPPHLERSSIPESLTAVLGQALAKQPEDRYSNCTAFAEAFADGCSGFADVKTTFFTTPLQVRTKVAARTVPKEHTGEKATTILQTSRPVHKNPITWLIAGVVALLLGGVIFVLASNPDDDKKTTPAPTSIAQIDTPTEEVADTPSPTATSFDSESAAQATFDAQSTKLVIEASQTAFQETVAAGVIARAETATATLWTKTPTSTSTNTLTPSRTPTNTSTSTHTPSRTATATDTLTPTQTFTPSATHTASLTYTPSQTPTPSDTPIATNTPTATSTSSSTPTATPRPSNTPAPTVDTRATILAMQTQPTATIVANYNPQLVQNVPGTLVFGPQNGNFTYRDDGFIRSVISGTDTRDFIAEVTFVNPYPTSEAVWDAGFLFRETATDEQLRLIIDSNLNYSLSNWQTGENVTDIESGKIYGLNLEDGDTNHLMLVVADGTGILFINGNLVVTLNVSSRTDSGSVSFGTSLVQGNLSEGEIMRYRDFAVWSIQENACILTPAQSQTRLREEPSTESEVAANIALGDQLLATGITSGEDGFNWLQVAGNVWVREDIVTTTGDCASLPTVSAQVATPTPTPTFTPSLAPTIPTATPASVGDASSWPIQAAPVFGPSSGILAALDNELIDYVPAQVNLKDFMVEVVFANPSPTSQAWDFGFLIHDQGTEFYTIAVNSTLEWNVVLTLDSGTTPLANGTLNNFDTSEGGSNRLRLVAAGNVALLYLNDEFVTAIELIQLPDAGDVSVASGLGTEYDVERRFNYSNFAIWSLEQIYGPVAGNLNHEADGNLETTFARGSAKDFVMTTTFTNPYDASANAWDYGFLFRNSPSETYIFGVDSNHHWILFLLKNNQYTTLAEGNVDQLNTGAGEQNQITILAIDHLGHLLINNQWVASLDLSALTASGGFALTVGLVNEVAGETTDYSDFSIWRLQ